jgi:hypothetical protein
MTRNSKTRNALSTAKSQGVVNTTIFATGPVSDIHRGFDGKSDVGVANLIADITASETNVRFAPILLKNTP